MNSPLSVENCSATSAYNSTAALRYSNYSLCRGEDLLRVDGTKPAAEARAADRAVRTFLLGDGCSCVAAKAAVATGGYRFGYYPIFGASQAIEGLARDLTAFIAERPSMPARYATFVATFGESNCGDETWFEKKLWDVLQYLHDLDAQYANWDPSVSSDPADPNFSFSFGGNAFFIVGMHPRSGRVSRRSSMPALAFNSHAQFREARESGDFDRIVRAVRSREVELQGSVNPELRKFGTRSEARQYSGRPTEDEWKCPFRRLPER